MITRVATLATSAVAALALAGCAASSGGAGGNTTSGAPTCTPDTMHTHTSGTLTIATDSPAYEPWFKQNDPTNGHGFESAVAYAVATQLGYAANQVKWVVAPFNSVIAPTPKKFDFDINEVSISEKRAKAVDFSSGYYDVAQAVVSLKGNKYANATSIKDLHGAKLGAQVGTTSFDAINEVIKPGVTPLEYPTNNLAVQALKNGTIDGLVVDLPTGLYVTAAQVDNSKIVGQLAVKGHPEQFGLVLDKGSSLTSCVTQAVDALRENGTLAELQRLWLTRRAGAPTLK
ncbi:MAG: polar amino acid transport system substrate-binding protein [Pseudonocardiales bacterium]|nr:polar amino acid transport system substrate-binding protein [Pseudonocardiales bacterium]